VAAVYWAAEYSLIRTIDSEDRSPAEPTGNSDRLLDIVVLHTSDASTLRALNTAATLAAELSARVHLVAARVVPYPLELNEPQVPISFTAQQLRQLAQDAGVEVQVDIILGRDFMTMLSAILKPRSLVVLGERRSRWWSFDWLDRENRLAQRLRRLGHQVVSADLD
jgi:hypothetical protein